ncbi:MAG TPA: uridine kinase [Gemmatimonadales bacterium]|nr:uridine kinase [Gemmatimonadales bacterium]
MSQRPLIIGIVGGSGSGKTTVARAILDALAGVDAALIDQDAYYRDLKHLTFDERSRFNFDHPEAFDTDLMVAQIEELAAGRPIDKPTYDYSQHSRAARTERVEPRSVLLVDGIMLFVDPRLRALFDIKIYVEVADDIRFIRRLQRDVAERGRSVESIIAQYLSTVRPMHLEFVEPSRRWADVIVPEGGHNRIGIEMIQARVLLEVERRGGAGG